MSSISRLFAFLVLCAPILCACGGGGAPLRSAAPEEFQTAPAVSPFGINGTKIFHIPNEVETNVARRLAWMKELGVRWDRSDLWWHVVEPAPGVYDYSWPDRVFEVLEAHGVQWYPILCYGAAGWQGHTAPLTDEDFQRFGEYVYRTVSRYKGRAPAWSVWNEPNIVTFWSPEPRVEDYARLLRISHEAIRRADPGAKVCAPVTAPLGNLARKFIERLFQLGGLEQIDLFDYHYYRNYPPESEVPREIAEIRALMRRYGEEKPIWISESGVSSSLGKEKKAFDLQASYVARNHLLCFGLGVQKFFYFDLQNWFDTEESAWDSQLGLVTAAGERKPSFFAYQTLVREIEGREIIGLCEGMGEEEYAILLHDPRTGEFTLAAWLGNDAESREIPVAIKGRMCSITHSLGEITTRNTGPDARLAIPLDRHPRYVTPVDPEVYLPMAGIRRDPALSLIAPGESIPFQILAAPLLGDPVVRSLEIQAGEGFSWDEALGVLTLNANLPPGRYPITALARVEVGQPGARRALEITRHAEVEVISVFEVALRPYREDGALFSEIRLGNLSSASMTETPRLLEIRADGGRRELAALAPQALPAGESRQLTVPMPAGLGLDYKGETQWIATYGAFSSKPFRVYAAPLSAEGPRVDGDLDDWSHIPFFEIASESQVLRNVGVWSPASASLRAGVWFTPATVYFAAEVNDDDPAFNPFEAKEIWRGDAMEFYLGLRGPTRRTVINKEFEYQIGIAPAFAGKRPLLFWFHKDEEIRAGEIQVRKTASGYQVEAAIPLSAIQAPQIVFNEGDFIALDLALDDLDNGDSAPAANDPGRALMWNGGPMNWIDPSGWGLAVLQKAE